MSTRAIHLMPTFTAPLLLPEEKEALEHRMKLRHWTLGIAAASALAAGITGWILTHS